MSARPRVRRPPSKSRQGFIAQLQRQRGIKEMNRRVLIVCEDQKSAPNYFNALRDELKLPALSVVVASSDGRTQPIQVVQTAINMCDKAESKDNDDDPFDEAWAVIDGDYGVEINNARNSAAAHEPKIKLAITTPCFEYWIILHFEDYGTTQKTSAQIVSQLEKNIPDYGKGSTKFGSIVGRYKDAMCRAKRGRDTGEFPNPEDQNPCSEIDKLIDSINNLVSES